MALHDAALTRNSSKAAAINQSRKGGISFAPPSYKAFIQPKLTVNQPNDIYEQEADYMADQIMTMRSPAVQAKPMNIFTLQRKCAHCEAEEEMQRKEMNADETSPGHDLENYVGGLGSGGQSLPDDVRGFYEPRFGHDFSNVKVHTDTVAVKSAQSINALAYTNGSNIVFNEGQYSPGTDSGKKLLAHELTHVVQQDGSGIQKKHIQRSPHAPEPMGGIQVIFDPGATLTMDPPASSPGFQDIGASDSTTFTGIQRGASGVLVFPITETWSPAAVPPGGTPADKCDFCEILRKAGIINLNKIPIISGLFPNLLPKVNIIPDVVIQECKKLGITNIREFLNFLNALSVRAQDPCSFSAELSILCNAIKFIPVVGPTIGLIQSQIATALNLLRSFALNNLPKECTDPNRVVPNQNSGSGNASSTLTVQLISLPGGALQLVGPPPRAITNGTGAELVTPVEFSKDSVPNGAIIIMQPMVRSTVVHNNGNLSTPETHAVAHPFTVRVQVQPPPSPKPYDCAKSFGPFVIGSDRFMNEDEGRQDIHDWYFGMEPHVREDLENSNGLLRVTGRASSTGSKTFNLELGEKRAKKVRDIIADFAGSDAHLRSFALGEFGAQTADNTEDANERRVDVDASGQVPGEKAVNMQGENCTGHLGETTSSGAIGPVTTGSGGENAGSPLSASPASSNGIEGPVSGSGIDLAPLDAPGETIDLDEPQLQTAGPLAEGPVGEPAPAETSMEEPGPAPFEAPDLNDMFGPAAFGNEPLENEEVPAMSSPEGNGQALSPFELEDLF